MRPHALALVVFVAAVPIRAAELDKYLPADTEVVVTFNVRQLLGSELLKSANVAQAKEALKNADLIGEVLRDLGFDPFHDLDRITVAGPGGNDKDRGLVIVRGTFDVAKFKAKADEAAKSNADFLKIHKVPDGLGGQHLVYETMVPEQNLPLFVAVVSKDLLLASPGKDYVADALQKGGRKERADLKSKDMRTLLEKMDDKQSLSVAALGSALAKGGNLPDNAKDVLEKLDAVGGGVTVTDEIKLEIVLSAKSAESAKEIDRAVSNGLNQALGLVALFANQNKEIAPAVEILKTIRSGTKGKLVTIKAAIGADILDKALGKDK